MPSRSPKLCTELRMIADTTCWPLPGSIISSAITSPN
jgi:hypothetical protein